MNLWAAAPFWLAGVALSIWAWRHRPGLTDGREWVGRWADGDDRQRQALGARKVTGPVVYWHYDETGECVYHGQAVNFARRMRQEAHERMSDSFHTWRAKSTPRRLLTEVEDGHIARLRPKFNRRGNPGRKS